MRLVQFTHNGYTRIGAEIANNGDIVDITAIDPSIPHDTRSFLEAGDSALLAATRAVASRESVVHRKEVKIKAPIKNPEKIICLGMNYVDHCLEQNHPIPENPILFFKLPSSIIGQGEDIVCPDIVKVRGNMYLVGLMRDTCASHYALPPIANLTKALEVVEKLSRYKEMDYEVELAIIIGKTGKNLKEAEAMDCVFGYTVAHDVSARDWQLRKNNSQWGLGKSFDTFCPLGPSIVHKNSLSDAHKLGIRCRLNGDVVQNSNTEKMVFKTAAAVSYISQFMTLKPGDVILTGTPPGVGCFKNPPIFLKKGDVVEVEIDEIGCLSNTVR